MLWYWQVIEPFCCYILCPDILLHNSAVYCGDGGGGGGGGGGGSCMCLYVGRLVHTVARLQSTYRSWRTRHASVVVPYFPQHIIVLWCRLKSQQEKGDLCVVEEKGDLCVVEGEG